uniref:Uncharacterized protein n=1 Tax=viral metagenome TaxID=1070528 RepID=A0A6C0LKS7_9ZZZZ
MPTANGVINKSILIIKNKKFIINDNGKQYLLI